MLQGGLVSITFRQLSPESVVKLVAKSNLYGIEWGGDVHVPHGNLEKAREVKSITDSNGLKTCAYGSYYRVGESEKAGLSFEAVLESALALDAPVIRVWAGSKGSDTADEAYWETVIEDSRRIAEIAAAEKVMIAYEFHRGTLTDTRKTVSRLLTKTNHENLYSYWQPPVNANHEECKQGLRDIGNKLSHIHAFYWKQLAGDIIRYPLSEGEAEWADYLTLADTVPGDRFILIEFVRDNNPECFIRDAATLLKLIGAISCG